MPRGFRGGGRGFLGGGGGANPGAGTELLYVERTTTFTSTNTNSADPDEILTLTGTIVGAGRPVYVEFFCGQLRHNIALSRIATVLQIDAVNAQFSMSTTGQAGSVGHATAQLSFRKVLTAGTSYVFTVGTYTLDAGTISYVAAATSPTFLRITQA